MKRDWMTLIAGPCVIEDEGFVLEVAKELKTKLEGLPIEFYFKSSFDKANRSSYEGFRGPGLKSGLKILEKVKSQVGVSLLTDFHTPDQAEPVAEVVDYLQVPAFLCRQSDMIFAASEACLKHGRRLNIKKGQFLAPEDTKNIVEKCDSAIQRLGLKPKRADWLSLCERGASFGYHTLVVDMVSFPVMKNFGVQVIHDATHSVQKPGAGVGGKSTGGNRHYIETLSRAAMAAGADGVFLECHPHPDKAKSDGPNAFPLEYVRAFVEQLLEFRELAKKLPKVYPESI